MVYGLGVRVRSQGLYFRVLNLGFGGSGFGLHGVYVWVYRFRIFYCRLGFLANLLIGSLDIRLWCGLERKGFRFGRRQPLSFTLSFGEILWFDAQGETRRCDWLERTRNLKIQTGYIRKTHFRPITALYFLSCTSNPRISPDDSASDRG
jgi:hypothetical protein